MKKKILIIEDEKILGEMYRDKFIQAGFDVVWADSAEEGIKALPKENPDLVLLDILLPRASGVGFMEGLKKQKEVSPIPPVVAFSNYDEPSTKKDAFRLGVKDYLIKTNYTPQEIVDKIKNYLK
jgi:DNA-binding response OmpR family regulator